jgi:8-oxo-dGTP diphosphatase
MSQEKPRYTVSPRVLVFVSKGDKFLMLKYSGKGENMTQEKLDRKDIYNCIGGHIEKGEDIIETAVKEAKEEAGIKLLNPKIKGIINVSGFSGKNIMNFIIVGETEDKPVASSLEGELEWIDKDKIKDITTFEDVAPILEKILLLSDGEMFIGTAKFDGKFKLLDMNLKTVPN